jgi:hypothetical protein
MLGTNVDAHLRARRKALEKLEIRDFIPTPTSPFGYGENGIAQKRCRGFK